MPARPGLALPDHVTDLGDRQLGMAEQRDEPQASGLGERAQRPDEVIEARYVLARSRAHEFLVFTIEERLVHTKDMCMFMCRALSHGLAGRLAVECSRR